MKENIYKQKLEKARTEEKLTCKLIGLAQEQEKINTALQLAIVEIYEKENEKNV